MPPAFVLSQDQTLRKIKLFYRKIRFKAFKILRLEINFVSCEFSRFTSHYSIFNQLPVVSTGDSFIIYHRFLFLQAQVWKFFKLFSDPHFQYRFISACHFVACLQEAQQKHNISPIFIFASPFLKFFQFFSNSHFRSVLYQPCAARSIRGATIL